MSDLKFWVGFNHIPGIGRVKFSLLESHFGDLEHAWYASSSELHSAGIDSKAIEAITASRPKINLEEKMEKLHRHQVNALTWNDPSFPHRLKEIPNVPPIIYVKGKINPADEWAIAVIGTRKSSAYGREVTHQLTEELVRNKITIVSGLARGIDSIAHNTAVETKGRTLAVLAHGLDSIYPPENTKLAHSIVEQGALISEYPIGTRARRENFPRRNRIMSGLSLGILIVESGDKGGPIITANWALEQNREVFAVPGSILSHVSQGTNRLIQDGAKLVQNVQDILEELNLTMIPRQLEMRELIPADDTESLLLRQLAHEPVHIDEVCRQLHLPIATVSSTLAMMELKGMVRQLGGMNYIIAQP